jgi:hypothetical protein
MEYLEMRGAVTLKPDRDLSIVNAVLQQLQTLEFADTGYVDIDVEDHILQIDAEGTVVESYTLKSLLAQLQRQLSSNSTIGITNNRWETKVILRQFEPRADIEPLAIVG